MTKKNELFGYEESLVELHKDGWNYARLARRFKVSYTTVRAFFNPEKKQRLVKGLPLSVYASRNLQALRRQVIDALGGKCCKCGFSDVRALQLDHIHGGGAKEIKSLGHSKIYKKILSNLKLESSNYQVLCANCNWIKRHENKEYK